MPTDLRIFVIQSMNEYAKMLDCLNKDWDVMEVGIAGDEKPGGNYKLFGIGNNYKTLDYVANFDPDIVADICDTKLPANSWDLIILSQTLEHIFTYEKAIKECFRLLKKGGYLILDCPFVYPYHASLPEFDDYWRISPSAMKELLNLYGYEVEVSTLLGGILTTSISKKPFYVQS